MSEDTKKTTSSPELGDMSPDDFRRYGHRIVDWIAEYLAHPERHPVLSMVQPGQILAQLPTLGPEQPETMDAVLADFEQLLLPGITHWNHPAFMAYFGITGSGPGILGELLAAGLNVNAMLWRTSPAATELEQRVMEWLRQWVGLPNDFEGVVYDTASISSLVAVAAARENVPGLCVREKGLSASDNRPKLRLYASEQAHSSIEKAAILTGIGQDGMRKIPTDREFRMDTDALESAIREDQAAGWHPFCVVATVGTTSTTSIDPVPRIASLCGRHGIWLHVDAAYGGCAAVVPEMRYVLDGCAEADSLVINPHKWLFTPLDFSAFYTRKLAVVRQAFSLVPEYLKTPEDSQVRNFMDYGPQLGRRFRALKLWMVMRHFGLEGIRSRLREHIRLAGSFASWVDEHPDFERCAPTPFSTICFRAKWEEGTATEQALDALNEKLLEKINASGRFFLSHTRLNGKFVLRMAIGNIRTTEAHVRECWELLCEQAALLKRISS
jgi:aromatic-L-amino-acid/L-tryptophan decarboxylase